MLTMRGESEVEEDISDSGITTPSEASSASSEEYEAPKRPPRKAPAKAPPKPRTHRVATCQKILTHTAVAPEKKTRTQLCLPAAFAREARLRVGPIELTDGKGKIWESCLAVEQHCMRIRRSWRPVVAALNLQEGQVINITAETRNRLLIEPLAPTHLAAAPATAAPVPAAAPWPVELTIKMGYMLRLPNETGGTICTEGKTPVPVLVPAPAAGGEPETKDVTITWVAGKCFLGAGWGALVRDLGLQAGQRVLLEAVSQEPWQLKITVLAGTSFLDRRRTKQRRGDGSSPEPDAPPVKKRIYETFL